LLVDYEAVLQDLRIHLETKDSHGRRELHTVLGELEAKHAIREGVTERALRIAGAKLSDELMHYGQDSTREDADGIPADELTATLS
jgi:hypothetical protein